MPQSKSNRKWLLGAGGLIGVGVLAFALSPLDTGKHPLSSEIVGPTSKGPSKEFMDSELMVRAGISEVGLTVGQFLELLTLAKQTNGKPLRLDRWTQEGQDNQYVATLSGTAPVSLGFEQIRTIPNHPVVMRTVEVNGHQVEPLIYFKFVIADGFRQPDVVQALERMRER